MSQLGIGLELVIKMQNIDFLGKLQKVAYCVFFQVTGELSYLASNCPGIEMSWDRVGGIELYPTSLPCIIKVSVFEPKCRT